MNQHKIFSSFFDVFRNGTGIIGKHIALRTYSDDVGRDCYIWDDGDDNILDWNDDLEYIEWRGIVEDVLGNDNSRVDIIFQRDSNHVFPAGCLEDCYNFPINETFRNLGEELRWNYSNEYAILINKRYSIGWTDDDGNKFNFLHQELSKTDYIPNSLLDDPIVIIVKERIYKEIEISKETGQISNEDLASKVNRILDGILNIETNNE